MDDVEWILILRPGWIGWAPWAPGQGRVPSSDDNYGETNIDVFKGTCRTYTSGVRSRNLIRAHVWWVHFSSEGWIGKWQPQRTLFQLALLKAPTRSPGVHPAIPVGSGLRRYLRLRVVEHQQLLLLLHGHGWEARIAALVIFAWSMVVMDIPPKNGKAKTSHVVKSSFVRCSCSEPNMAVNGNHILLTRLSRFSNRQLWNCIFLGPQLELKITKASEVSMICG